MFRFNSERLERFTYDPCRFVFGKSLTLTSSAIIAVAFLTIFYFAIASNVKERKRRAWILTLASSCVMSLGGILALTYLFVSSSHLGIVSESTLLSESTIISDTPLCRQILVFFIAYCFMDLLIGSIYYGELMTFLFGWCHHIAYILLCGWVIQEKISIAFGVFAILEAPTAILAIGHVKQGWRRDLTYGMTFFFFAFGVSFLFINPLLVLRKIHKAMGGSWFSSSTPFALVE